MEGSTPAGEFIQVAKKISSRYGRLRVGPLARPAGPRPITTWIEATCSRCCSPRDSEERNPKCRGTNAGTAADGEQCRSCNHTLVTAWARFLAFVPSSSHVGHPGPHSHPTPSIHIMDRRSLGRRSMMCKDRRSMMSRWMMEAEA